ncbi:MAG TPA: sensor domain-containing diguanylate cyclase [Solirubrobacteraceae bacterium]|jgi:diguanylate cyclase (GGDEF)-like protein|nr:sensor domain-containing diguanylate cyclase [Solirubrobacteraceae bacterium]
MARALGCLYMAGAAIGSASVLLPHIASANVAALWTNIGLAGAGGVLGLLVLRRAPRWVFHVALVTGTLVITRAIYYSGDGSSFYSIWYVWVALYAFYFFRRFEAIAHVLVVGAAYAVVLDLTGEALPVARWLTTITTLLIAGVFIETLVRRVRRQRARADEDAAGVTTLVEAMQGALRATDARHTRVALCQTAQRVTGASHCALWEPDPDRRRLAITAVVGEGIGDMEVSLENPGSGVAEVFTTGDPRLLTDLEDSAESFPLMARAGIRAALWQPVERDGTTIAVLAVYWQVAVPALEGNVAPVVGLLATQVAVALERADLLVRMERIARTDELTGLPNRRAWQEELRREMARAVRGGHDLCVAMLDLDGFKELNDSLGHQAGDQLLKHVAASWSSAMRASDFVVRYGGDEFAVLLPDCDLEQAEPLIDRLLAATPANQSCSVGLARWAPGEDSDALLAQADQALYEAKRLGGNRVVSKR